MNSLQFLQRILPDEGLYCGIVIQEKRRTQKLFESITDLNEFIVSHLFDNVYHACANFKDRSHKKPRSVDNAAKLKSFFFDIDIREAGDHYRDAEEALKAVMAFAKQLSLPLPLTVFTGGGLHCYWPLNKSIPVDQWQPYADAIKTALKKWGVKADPTRTADASSILRPVGTTNPKYEQSNVVELWSDCQPLDLSKFRLLLFYNNKPKGKVRYDLVHAEAIFDGCAQMAGFACGDYQSEPVWRACGTILAQCLSGEKLWHGLSSLDKRYDQEETQKKWDNIQEFDNATTCEWFRDNNPDKCKGCPFKGRTPVQLAREATSTVVADVALPKLPYPYKFSSEGELTLEKGKNGGEEKSDVESIVLSKFPIVVTNVFRSEYNRGEHSIGLETYTKHQGWQTHQVRLAELNRDPAATFAACNIPFRNNKEIAAYINRMHESLKMERDAETTYERFGWKNNRKFLLGDRLLSIVDGRPVETRVTLGREARGLAAALRRGGTKGASETGLQAWRKAAQGLFAPGHEWQALTLISSMAAPLMHFAPDSEGGLVLSLAAMQGGEGKTTATAAGASVWGDFEAINCTPGDTINARFSKVATLGNLPTAFDEQGRDSAKIANDFVKSFTVGREKERLNRNAERVREPRRWKTILLSNANKELAGAIRAERGSDAMADRVLEINVERLPLGKGKVDGGVKAAFLNNPGYAGPIIIFVYLSFYDEIERDMPKKINEYIKLLGSSKDRFLANYLAAIDICARLVARSELLTFDPQTIINYAIKQATVIGLERQYSRNSVDILSEFLRDNIDKTLVTKKYVANRMISPDKEPRFGLVIRVEKDAKEIVIAKEQLKDYIYSVDRSPREFYREMNELGLLKHRVVKRNLAAGTTITAMSENCVVFTSNHPLLDPDSFEEQEELSRAIA